MCAMILHADEAEKGVRATKKNYNNELGLPLTILGKDAPGRSVTAWLELCASALWYGLGFGKTGIRTLVLEMGADKPGDLAHLTHIAPPTISIITGVTPGSSEVRKGDARELSSNRRNADFERGRSSCVRHASSNTSACYDLRKARRM